ncbi:MAG: FKBP-type peptidyl-prolyl cis-trans isomerase [Gemmatimonadaceae bacterium]
MRFRLLLATALSSAIVGCNAGGTEPSAPLIDCSTLATSLAANASTLTTTASGLQYRDVTVGTGATYATGTTVSVRYAGCLTSGARFDSNEPPKNVISFKLGSGAVIKGWDEGLVGMKVGGRRQLVIPPSLGYGAVANGPIPANSTMVFTVDAISTP